MPVPSPVVGIQIGRYFQSQHLEAAKKYYSRPENTGFCPPGLAKKNSGCLPPGQAKLWRKGEMTEAKVKDARREEAMAAAEILGASVEFFDIGDYPMRADKDTLFRLADVYRRVQPEFVLSHSLKDPYNYDHPLAMHLAQASEHQAQQIFDQQPGGLAMWGADHASSPSPQIA